MNRGHRPAPVDVTVPASKFNRIIYLEIWILHTINAHDLDSDGSLSLNINPFDKRARSGRHDAIALSTFCASAFLGTGRDSFFRFAIDWGGLFRSRFGKCTSVEDLKRFIVPIRAATVRRHNPATVELSIAVQLTGRLGFV